MKIGNDTGNQTVLAGALKGKKRDAQAERIRRQINNVQKQMQNVESNEKLSAEEKLAKKKELQEQLDDLNKQMNQRQLMKMQEEIKKSGEPVNIKDTYVSSRPGKRKGIGTATMTSILAADQTMKQASIAQSVKTNMEGETNVLKAQIKQDEMTGAPTEQKEAQLANLQEKVEKVESHISDALVEVNEQLGSTEEENSIFEKDDSEDKGDLSSKMKLNDKEKDAQNKQEE